MTTIEALRLRIDTLQLEKQQFESQNLKLELEKSHYKEEHEHLTVENEQLKALYEELLRKFEEEGTIRSAEGDKANEITTLVQQLEAQQVNVVQLRSKCEQLEKSLESWRAKCNGLEKELNALRHSRTHYEKLEKDLADLEGWKCKCAELQQKVTQIESNAELECFRAVAKERKQWEACEERLVQQLRELQQNIASAGLPSGVHHQNMTQNQGEAVKQSQVLHQGGDVKVPKGIVTGEHHDETSYQSSVGFECQSQFLLRNVQLFGSEYQYA